jgi:predicted RNase H-like HicB family nuclease
MKFNVTLDRDEDGAWVAECPSIPGCVSQGTTRDGALANVREAISLCLEVRAERGMPIPALAVHGATGAKANS